MDPLKPLWFFQETESEHVTDRPVNDLVTIYLIPSWVDQREKLNQTWPLSISLQYIWTRNSTTLFSVPLSRIEDLANEQAFSLATKLVLGLSQEWGRDIDLFANETLDAGFEFDWIGQFKSLQDHWGNLINYPTVSESDKITPEQDVLSQCVFSGKHGKVLVAPVHGSLGFAIAHAPAGSLSCNAEVYFKEDFGFPKVRLIRSVAPGDVIAADLRVCGPLDRFWMTRPRAAFSSDGWAES